MPLVSSKADCSTAEFLSGTGSKRAKSVQTGAKRTRFNTCKMLKFEKMQFKLEDLGLKQRRYYRFNKDGLEKNLNKQRNCLLMKVRRRLLVFCIEFI